MKSGQGIYIEKNCTNDFTKRPAFTLLPHQQKLVDIFPSSKKKGMVLFHKLGSGKTCTSVAIADKMISDGKIDKVYVLTPGSLRENWIKEYCRTCGLSGKYLKKYFIFITTNFNIHKKLKEFDFNDSLVIIDEAHNLINGVKNNSINYVSLYQKMVSSDCKILFLTGTPIYDSIGEWAYIGYLLDPENYEPINFNLDLTHYEGYIARITDKMLKGIISYYPGDAKYYPEVRMMKPIISYVKSVNRAIESSYGTYRELYLERVSMENKLRGSAVPSHLFHSNRSKYESLKRLKIMASKYIMSRTISNFCPPNAEKALAKINAKKNKDIEEVEISAFESVIPDKYVEDGGWITDELFTFGKLIEKSPKFVSVILNIIFNDFNTKHVIYTYFLTSSGADMLKILFDKANIPCEIFSGELSDTNRTNLLRKFNSKANRNGEYIKVLIISEAGAEGITVLEVNNFHILESSPRETKTRQAIGRVVRYKSHVDMPPERRYVNVYRYWTATEKIPKLEDVTIFQCVDAFLYVKGLKTLQTLDDFNEKLIKNSV